MVLATASEHATKFSFTSNLTGFTLFEQASVANAKFAFWLKEQQKSMKPKAFRELLQGQGMLRREANKFIKLAENAQHFDSEDLAGLGPMMFSLTAPRYKTLWQAMQDEGTLTQDVVDALKKELYPAKKASKSDTASIWREPPGGGTRYCQLPPIHDQETGVKLEQIITSLNVTPQETVKIIVACYETVNPKKTSQSAFIEEPQQSLPLVPQNEQASAQALLEMAYLDPQTEAFAHPDENIQELLIPGLITAEVAVQTGLESATPILPSAVETSTELEVAQADLNGYLQAQAEAIAPENKKTGEDVKQVSLPLSQNERDVYPTSSNDIVGEEEAQISDDTFLDLQQTDSLPLNPPILPTGRYKQGWQVGEYAVPNTTYGYLPMSFRLWCLGQPVRIEAVAGSTGSVQTLTVARHDGETHHAMSDWLEETTEPPLTLPTTTQPQGATPDANYTPATPTLRYKQGWNVGDMALANTVGGEYFVNWCEGKPIRIEQATGGVGEIQILRVSRHDGQTDMSFGNWIEDVPDSTGESASATTPDSQSDKETALYKVIQTGDCWSGEVVKIVKPGDTYHQVSLQSGGKAWTEVKNECLIPLSSAEGIAEQNGTLIAERIVREYGLAVGDTVEWMAGDYTLKGKIARLTELGAFIDEGCLGHTWIKYEYLKKIDSKAIASEKRTTEKPTIEPSQQEPESETPDYSKLSESLKKAKNWERVTELVDRDATTLTAAVRDWSAEQKSVLINHIVNYLKKNKRAILCRELDWIPIQSLKKVFFKLSFKVRIFPKTANWQNKNLDSGRRGESRTR